MYRTEYWSRSTGGIPEQHNLPQQRRRRPRPCQEAVDQFGQRYSANGLGSDPHRQQVGVVTAHRPVDLTLRNVVHVRASRHLDLETDAVVQKKSTASRSGPRQPAISESGATAFEMYPQLSPQTQLLLRRHDTNVGRGGPATPRPTASMSDHVMSPAADRQSARQCPPPGPRTHRATESPCTPMSPPPVPNDGHRSRKQHASAGCERKTHLHGVPRCGATSASGISNVGSRRTARARNAWPTDSCYPIVISVVRGRRNDRLPAHRLSALRRYAPSGRNVEQLSRHV